MEIKWTTTLKFKGKDWNILDDEVIGYLWALKLVNEGLLNGLKVSEDH